MKAILGDITTLDCEAIVNAANTSLLGGGGVDGAIHRAAGPDLVAECRLLGGCKPGEAKVTKGHNLPAQWIIHTVGPVWRGGANNEEDTLTSCYQQCLAQCAKLGITSVAFPCISTGIYGFPKPRAAQIAVSSCKASTHSSLDITFCCFEREDLELYLDLLQI